MAECSDVGYVGNYDVFINFRGVDTRQGFVYRLHEELLAEGIHVFLDNEQLNYGKRLDEELPQAIRNSKIYVTVISETYASSKWCLRELAEIVRNKQQFKDKKEILPVFYKIKTDDVKLKTDLFKNQLNSLLKGNVSAETIEEWAVALKDISGIRGWPVPIHGSSKQDAEFCRQIVKRVSIILRVKHKPLPKDLIGMEDPVEEVMRLLDIRNPNLQVIGIHGMGGSGKTTLAKLVYNRICDTFDCCCFLPDVRESLGKDKGSRGCLEVQKKLLKEVSYRGDRNEITDVENGIRRIQLSLQGKKVLLVFDDVSKPDQVASLIGHNYSMFGRECRIIITTRDDRVLRNREFAEFTKIHMMKVMEIEHALELFNWHAFGAPKPPNGYTMLSNEAISLTGRLPLSLEITGSLFFIGGRKNWKHTIEKIKKMPNEDVQERLKISYEDLNEQTREIFLDIACFFVGKRRSDEVAMWDTCGFFPELALEELVSLCLIKIEDNGTFWMHDHIKDLGREIVRQEGPKDKAQCSRIWNKQDSIDILTTSRKKKNNKIEGILLEHLNGDEILTLSGENCANLDRLRFLHLEASMFAKPDVQLKGSFKHVLPNLRWLSLPGMKMKGFNVTNFKLKKLAVINLTHSDVTESWPGWKKFKDLPSLEVLNLMACLGLKKTPDLSYCTSLKTLILTSCKYLEEIDHSIRSLTKLRRLNLSYCKRLRNLPDSIGELVELEELLLLGCNALVGLPNSLTSLPKLHILDVSSCEGLENLPDSVGEMVQLTEVDISYLVALKKKKLPGFISKQKRLEVLRANSMGMQGIPAEIEELHYLREISLNGSSICGLPSLVKLSRLEKLSLRNCNHLQQLPELPKGLVHLHVSSLSLQSIPDYSDLIHLTNLKLDLAEWEDTDADGEPVRSVGIEPQEWSVDWIWRLTKLKKLYLRMPKSCTTTIQSVESSSVGLAQLEHLTLHCSILVTCVIPSFLYSLTRLDISLYRETMTLSLPRLNRLTHFSLSESGDLAQILGLGELESLISLVISGCNSLEILDEISKLRQLVNLEIHQCKKVRVISVVPSLKELVIIGCKSLENLAGPPSESCLDDLHRVEHLKIVNCPLLENKLPGDLELLKGRFLANEMRRRRRSLPTASFLQE